MNVSSGIAKMAKASLGSFYQFFPHKAAITDREKLSASEFAEGFIELPGSGAVRKRVTRTSLVETRE